MMNQLFNGDHQDFSHAKPWGHYVQWCCTEEQLAYVSRASHAAARCDHSHK